MHVTFCQFVLEALIKAIKEQKEHEWIKCLTFLLIQLLTLRDYLLHYLNLSISIISRAVEVRLYFIVLNIISCLHLIPFLFYLNFRERHLIFRACFIFKVSDSRSKIQFTIFKKESNNKVFYVTFNVCSMMFDEKVPNIKNK